MKLKNVLIVVEDIEKSRKFYHNLFGIELVVDNDMLTTTQTMYSTSAMY